MNESRLDELAALHALGLLDEKERTELLNAMERDKTARHRVADYEEVSARLALAIPPVAPPSSLKQDIMQQLSSRQTTGAPKRISLTAWMVYAIAACLMFLGIGQTWEILKLKARLNARSLEVSELKQRTNLMGLQIATLEAKDASMVSAKVVVAWDPVHHRGVISIHNLPAPPPGHDYQLWVLDPAKGAINAGLLTSGRDSQPFQATPTQAPSPGFAISLEPSGGRPSPTGSILFAAAPEK